MDRRRPPSAPAGRALNPSNQASSPRPKTSVRDRNAQHTRPTGPSIVTREGSAAAASPISGRRKRSSGTSSHTKPRWAVAMRCRTAPAHTRSTTQLTLCSPAEKDDCGSATTPTQSGFDNESISTPKENDALLRSSCQHPPEQTDYSQMLSSPPKPRRIRQRRRMLFSALANNSQHRTFLGLLFRQHPTHAHGT